ncbi:MAG: hypothetical protein WCG47_21365 [Dermatophilaceae bacterium]
MSTTTPTAGGTGLDVAGDRDYSRAPVRRSTETKASFKTSEFFVYIAAVVGVLLASMMLGRNEDTSDFFGADKAWLYVTLLSIGYMISRGLAKSGSREHYTD